MPMPCSAAYLMAAHVCAPAACDLPNACAALQAQQSSHDTLRPLRVQ
jgi:hypothetical protein